MLIFRKELTIIKKKLNQSPLGGRGFIPFVTLFTGFATAAFIAWKLTVTNAIIITNDSCQRKHPPTNINPVCKILQPFVDKRVSNRNGDHKAIEIITMNSFETSIIILKLLLLTLS